MLNDSLVFGTISAAVVAWALAEYLRSRWLWAAGAALAVVHSAAAFHLFYDWSHDTARELTRQQTASLTGVNFSGGIYINYIFLAVWMADGLWWLAGRRSYEYRPRALSVAIRGFIFLIIVNGAVIFADGLARAVGLAATALVVWSEFKVQSSKLERKVRVQP